MVAVLLNPTEMAELTLPLRVSSERLVSIITDYGLPHVEQSGRVFTVPRVLPRPTLPAEIELL